MSRSVPWRRSVTDTVSWRQDQAERATMYILRNVGPTGFLLQEDDERKKYKVFLGDPHSCTCQTFKKDKDLCQHICWVILKKFRVPRQNPVSFQKGLVEREINEILRGVTQKEDPRKRGQGFNVAKGADKNAPKIGPGGKPELEQRPITEDDICPICQDELLEKHEPVTYCRYGCAKSIHIKCMKVWAEHQKSSGETTILCPLCRENFGPIQALEQEYRNSSVRKTRAERLDLHLGSVCRRCRTSPIQGKCYRCTNCVDYCLCQGCFATNTHMEHSFLFRQKSTQRWRPAERGSGTILPTAVASDLQNRELSAEDYDLLLQLDRQQAEGDTTLPEYLVQALPSQTIRHGSMLLSPGAQCRICLRTYSTGQLVKRLPCRHEFHGSCINQWLLHQRGTCPVDGTNMYTAIREAVENARAHRAQRQQTPASNMHPEDANNSAVQLEIPGVGIARLRGGILSVRQTRAVRDERGHAASDSDSLESTFTLTGSGYGSRQASSAQDLVRSNSTSSLTSLRRGSQTPPRSLREAATPPQSRETERTTLRQTSVNSRTGDASPHAPQANDRVPVPPSIPLPHTVDITPLLDDILGVPDRGTNRMPQPRGRLHHPAHITPPSAERNDTAPSIPLPREEESMRATVQGLHPSAASPVSGRPPLPRRAQEARNQSGGAEQDARDRGRLRHRHQAQERRRSASGRLGSVERPSSAARLELLESLFLGTGGAGVVLEHSRTNNSQNKRRAKKPVRNAADNPQTALRDAETSGIVLSGSALSTLTLHDRQ